MSQQQPPQGPPSGYGPPGGQPPGYPPQGYRPPPGYQPQGYGQPYAAPVSWYHSPVMIGLSVFFCWPVGLILIWTSPKISGTAKLLVTAGVGALFMMALGAMALGARTATSGTVATTRHNEDEPHAAAQAEARNRAATPVAETLNEACLSVSQKFGTSSKLSDLQKDELWKDYKGKSFSWTLEITEVSAGTFGGYTVQAKCSPQSPSLIQDIQLSYDAEAKSFVMGLVKGNAYTLNGTLKHTSTLFGLAADGRP